MFSADFNPRSHEGSDRRYHRPERDPLFQSTLPRGERHGSSQFSGMPVVISIHAPTRGATHGSANQYKSNLIFQSTLPRGERRLDTKAMKCNNKISIHAPTRGATAVENPVGIISGISIHAPTRGATQTDRIRDRQSYNFNPRSHEGSDRLTNLPHTVTWISIHAPTRGATFVLLITHTFIYISIHAPTRGATFTRIVHYFHYLFQSTLPRGERPHTTHSVDGIWDFNPRSHEGSDE